MNFPDIGNKSGDQKPSLFIRLKSGESIKGIFRGEPKIFHTHWVDKKPFPCTGEKHCDLCKTKNKASFRFRLNMLIKEDGIMVAKIFEGSYGVLLDLKALHEGDYNLEETLVSVSRVGEGQQTRYTILPVKNNGGITPELFQKYMNIPLNDLSGKKQEQVEDFNELDKALGS